MTANERPINGQKVAIYIRWSTDDQGDGTTLDVQLDGCRHYLLSQGWTVSESLIFIDDGYSGGNLDRPALTRLRSLIRRGQVDCVVVFKVDRLSRSVVDTVKLVLEEWDGRTYLKSAREPIDTTTAMGKQFFYMLVSYAEWERSVIRERTVSGRRRRAREGYKPSAIAPFGYRHSPTVTGALEIVEEEAELVRRIFRLYTGGQGAKAIISQLNREATPFRGGAPWNERTLLYLLSNRIYVGDMVYGRRTRNPRRGKESGEAFWSLNEEPLVVESSPFIPPILDRATFGQAEAIRAGRAPKAGAASGRANASPYLLTGLARCRCGLGLYARSDRYYGCIGKKSRGAAACDAANLPQGELDREIARRVRERFGGHLAQAAWLEQLRSTHQRELRAAEAEARAAESQLAGLTEQARRVRRDYRAGQLAAAAFQELQAEIAAEQGAARQRQEGALARLNHLRRSAPAATDLTAIDRWESLTVPEQKQLLRHFIEALTIYRAPGAGDVSIDLRWFTPA